MMRVEASLAAATGKVAAARADWLSGGKLARLWAREAGLWTGGDEARWLGWLDIAGQEQARAGELRDFARQIQAEGFRDVVLIGMGGSSLGAEVLAESFGPQAGWPRFHALDSTDPDQITTLETRIDLARTLFLVASKSGSTLEPNILKDYFHARLNAVVGQERVGRHFVAITDPGSSLEKQARGEGFAEIFHGVPEIGGRYSVLSRFGLVPAAAMGLDVEKLLARASDMAARCKSTEDNPGLALGLAWGVLAREEGRDKITISASERLSAVGGWLEQLIAESTGKNGKGLIPIDGEPLASPALYGADRIFLHLRLKDDAEPAQLAALEQAGHPVLRLVLDDTYDLGGLFFAAEIATAVAGAVLGIHPFDQPDVEASKIKTRELTTAYEKDGALPLAKPVHRFAGLSVYAEGESAARISSAANLTELLRLHFGSAKVGDYVGLLAFIERSGAHIAVLQSWRILLREKLHVATAAQFGPRFLHSTGQAYKGGPDSGIFLALTAEPLRDLAVPGRKFSFATVEQAQAMGDFAVLCERGRRALRIHLDDLEQGLKTIGAALEDAMR